MPFTISSRKVQTGVMINKNNKSEISGFIKNLCQGASEEKLQEAEQNFIDYLIVVKRISDRLEVEGKEIINFDEKGKKDYQLTYIIMKKVFGYKRVSTVKQGTGVF